MTKFFMSVDQTVPVEPGDFSCLPISGQVGKLIRVGQWLNGSGFRNYEHAEINVGDPEGVSPQPLGYTMGAYIGGAALVPIPGNQDGWLWSTGHIPLTDTQRAVIVQTALGLKGTPYSALDYFAIAGHRLHVPDPGGVLRDYIGDTRHMICSQLVDYCYMQAGVHLFNDGRWPGYVTPEDLANVIMHPENIVIGKPGINA